MLKGGRFTEVPLFLIFSASLQTLLWRNVTDVSTDKCAPVNSEYVKSAVLIALL